MLMLLTYLLSLRLLNRSYFIGRPSGSSSLNTWDRVRTQEEQLSSCSQQRVVTTVEESVLKTEMTGLESQEEDAPKRILLFKPMSWLGQIRTHRWDESWSFSL
jgi:hypothetical protein